MQTFLLRVNDAAKADALARFLRKMDFVEELLPVSYWQDDDFDDAAMEKQVKENTIRRKNPAITKHLQYEDLQPSSL